MTKQIINQVKNEINKAIKKNQRDIEMALIKPLSPDYPFSTNGIYFLIGRPGAGKSYWIWSHIMITEKLFKKPYYSKIIFCSTSGKADKTAEVLHKSIKTPIDYVNENELMDFLKKHLKRKAKYCLLVNKLMFVKM